MFLSSVRNFYVEYHFKIYMSEKLTNSLCGKKREKIVFLYWYLPVNKEVNSARVPRPQRVEGGGQGDKRERSFFFFSQYTFCTLAFEPHKILSIFKNTHTNFKNKKSTHRCLEALCWGGGGAQICKLASLANTNSGQRSSSPPSPRRFSPLGKGCKTKDSDPCSGNRVDGVLRKSQK